MLEKTNIPFCTTDDPPCGNSSITCCVFGDTPEQAEERYQNCRKPHLEQGSPEPDQDGKRFFVRWVEKLPGLADVIQFSSWPKRKSK